GPQDFMFGGIVVFGAVGDQGGDAVVEVIPLAGALAVTPFVNVVAVECDFVVNPFDVVGVRLGVEARPSALVSGLAVGGDGCSVAGHVKAAAGAVVVGNRRSNPVDHGGIAAV